MSPLWRDRLWAGGATVVALVLGFQIALGQLAGAAGLALIVIALLGYRFQPANLQLIILGTLFTGYLIGNRGFAQFMPVPGLPLLPAEAGLAALGTLQAIERLRQPHPRPLGPIDWCIGAWIILGIARMLFDGPRHGMLAVRDFAMVYYAAFFFLAANLAHRRTVHVAHLLTVLRWAAVIMAPLYLATQIWPGVLETTLTLRGAPLIFYKADLAGVFAALGATLHMLRFEQTGRWRHVLFTLLLLAVVLATNNRSALLALLVGAAGLLLAGRWRFTALLGTGGVLGALLLVAVATWRGDTWRETPLASVYDRVVSLADPFGQGRYVGESTSNKGDNNLFRMVWWEEVAKETLATHPVFGLGFGHDLSYRFLREYYPFEAGQFSTRSPHSILVTIFGRMGFVGLALFLPAIGLVVLRIWQHGQTGDLDTLAPPLAAGLILVSAFFGVVLEGPMGAVLFWSLLGLGEGLRTAQSPDAPDAPPAN